MAPSASLLIGFDCISHTFPILDNGENNLFNNEDLFYLVFGDT